MKVFKWLIILIAVVPVVLIGSIYVRNKAIGPAGWAYDNTVKRLKATMKDPDSMVVTSYYTVVKPTPDGDTEYNICGIVDGRNSFGGYTGGTRFASHSKETHLNTFDTWTVQVEDQQQAADAARVRMLSSFDAVYWNAYCVDATHPPVTVKDLARH